MSERLTSAEKKILTFETAVRRMSDLHQDRKTIVLAQGAFDIVHVGHLLYLRMAKEKADLLFVGVESDEFVKLNKGSHRPYNSLTDRLNVVAEFQSVDYTFAFNDINVHQDSKTFIERLSKLKPNMLAVSSYDPLLENKKTSAAKAGVEVLIIEDPWVNSTTRLAQIIGLE